MSALRITWQEFIDAAVKTLSGQFVKFGLGKPVFMKKNGYEPDSENWSDPDYVLIPLDDGSTGEHLGLGPEQAKVSGQ